MAKSFARNHSFFTDETPAEALPVDQVGNIEVKEKKTRRVQLVLTPSLYDQVLKAAKSRNMSFNEYANRILENATK